MANRDEERHERDPGQCSRVDGRKGRDERGAGSCARRESRDRAGRNVAARRYFAVTSTSAPNTSSLVPG